MSATRPPQKRLALRWTVGSVSARGFEALRLSVWGAWQLFGPGAAYVVCVNNLEVAQAQALTGDVPKPIRWLQVTQASLPEFLRPHLDAAMAEGVGWKFAPLRLFPDCYELALDNDCILWQTPTAVSRWLEGGEPGRCLFACDVRRCLGQFSHLCGPEALNSGIRGLPPDFDLADALQTILAHCPVRFTSELDEQGLQAAAVSLRLPPLLVPVDEVSICSPFPPHLPCLGRCGAHFVGLNAKSLPWSLAGRPAVDYIQEHWLRHRPALFGKVGLSESAEAVPRLVERPATPISAAEWPRELGRFS